MTDYPEDSRPTMPCLTNLLAIPNYGHRLMLRALYVFFLIGFSSVLAFSQATDPATVNFTLDFPGSQPERYSIRIQSDGASHYESSGKLSEDSDQDDSFSFDFTASP